MKKRKRIFILDGTSLVYRAFHAIPATFVTSKGQPTNAIFGFTRTIRKILKDFSPDYIIVAFDMKGPTFRHEAYEEYKAERPPMPGNLSGQLPYIKRLLKAMNITALERESYEADDIIAAVVKEASLKGLKSYVITGDKDLYQLVDANTVIFDYLKAKEYSEGDVVEKFGVGPDSIRDLMGLAGDSSDNIPGVPGIGIKTAAKLVREFGSLEKIYERIEEIDRKKLKENLLRYKDQAFLSRELATLNPDVKLDMDPEGFVSRGPDNRALAELFKELEFGKLLEEVIKDAEVEAAADDEGCDFRLIEGEGELERIAGELRAGGRIALTLFIIDGPAPFVGLKGVSVASGPSTAIYLPVPLDAAGAPEAAVSSFLTDILPDPAVVKVTDSSKALHLYALKKGFSAEGITMDTTIASYLINPSRPDHKIEGLVFAYLGRASGVVSEADLPEGDSWIKACKKACNIYEMSDKLNKMLEDDGLKKLFTEIEIPLAKVLASMELEGIKVDPEILRDLSKEMDIELTAVRESVFRSAGAEFNLNSPKQLADILFNRLKLKPVKKTKTGFSTNEEVLTRLAPVHEVPGLILKYRSIAKLKSTYVDALLGLVNPETGRIHTSFNQTVTATGRLSSSRPNLQNIPVRGGFAPRIRRAFVAGEGFTLLAADYSQIELRLVAHLSGDASLQGAFNRGEDIHARTACEIFGLKSPAEVSTELRRRAKAINFGIIYGMGPYGLSTELGIPMDEAQTYIENYFNHYEKVRDFITRTIDEAQECGYTTTLFGRRRFIPELMSPLEQTRKLGKRLAVNTPVQGSAADIIKAAMIRIYSLLEAGGFASRMLLQIHDELVLEVERGEVREVTALVRKEMEGVVTLSVPLKVNMKRGADWSAVEPY